MPIPPKKCRMPKTIAAIDGAAGIFGNNLASQRVIAEINCFHPNTDRLSTTDDVEICARYKL